MKKVEEGVKEMGKKSTTGRRNIKRNVGDGTKVISFDLFFCLNHYVSNTLF